MGDDEGGAAAKRSANGLLDETICLSVDGCCRLVQYKNLQKNSKRYRNNKEEAETTTHEVTLSTQRNGLGACLLFKA